MIITVVQAFCRFTSKTTGSVNAWKRVAFRVIKYDLNDSDFIITGVMNPE